MQTEMMNLFAVPVVRSSIARGFTADEMNYFQAQLHNPVNAISNLSSRNKNVLEAPIMASLNAVIQQSLVTLLGDSIQPL